MIRWVSVPGGRVAPDVGWCPIGNSVGFKSGDVLGRTTAGLAGTLNNHSGGTIISSTGGVLGISVNKGASDASGNMIAGSIPTTIDPGVPIRAALPSYSNRVSPASPISGVRRGQIEYWTPSRGNFFIQRQKQGTRINDSVCGKKCDLVWNDTTLEWEVDTSATSVNDIMIADAHQQLPWYADNKTYWDSAGYATDTYGAWIVFQFLTTFDASSGITQYSSITSLTPALAAQYGSA